MGHFRKLIVAAASAAMLAGASIATAQPAPPPAADQAPIDPAKLALAHKMLDAQMGQINMPALLRNLDQQMFAQMMTGSPKADPAMQRRLEAAVEKAQAEMFPHMLDSMAAAFARNLSQQELQDAVGFYSSPSGRAIVQKMPAIMNEVVGAVIQWMPRMREAVIESLCADNGCTPAQREALEHPQPPPPPAR
jgi:hypothetical protein